MSSSGEGDRRSAVQPVTRRFPILQYLAEGKTGKEASEEGKAGKESMKPEEPEREEDAIPIAITYGYWRDHRADLKQWMVGLATTHDGDVPIFMRPLEGKPSFVTVSCLYQEEGRYQHKGRPKQGAAPDSTVWHIVGTLTIDHTEVEAQIHQQASFILATNVIEEPELSHEQVYVKYKEQGGVERGCAFPQRSALFGLFRLRQKARTGNGLELYHGAVLIGLSLGRASVTLSTCRNRGHARCICCGGCCFQVSG